MTFHESRAATLRHFPDNVPFGTICLSARRRPLFRTTSRPPPKELTQYWLHFSSERDVIGLGTGTVQCKRIIANWTAGSGHPLLVSVRHVALHAGERSRGRYRQEMGYPYRVERPWKQPLWEILSACFPRLKPLSFAVLDRQSEPGANRSDELIRV